VVRFHKVLEKIKPNDLMECVYSADLSPAHIECPPVIDQGYHLVGNSPLGKL